MGLSLVALEIVSQKIANGQAVWIGLTGLLSYQ